MPQKTEEDFADVLKCPECGKFFTPMHEAVYPRSYPEEPEIVSPHYQFFEHVREDHDGAIMFPTVVKVEFDFENQESFLKAGVES